jgi:hypothetical protein
VKSIIFSIFILASLTGFAQYPPAAGLPGSTAIYADSSIIQGWATSCICERGWADISDTTWGRATFGTEQDVLGKADNNVISLGDHGMATLSFPSHITNGPGPDFAIFENAFIDDFLELAFVEVSSNGIDFFRFPAFSLTQTDTQATTFATTDPTLVHNLAGKYRSLYGTPFDLDEIPNHPLLDKNNISHVRIIDVVGSINPEFASYDSEGRIINDPWPTPFNTSGFDLDAVGIIHCQTGISTTETKNEVPIFFPNPASDVINLNVDLQVISVEIRDIRGSIVLISTYPSIDITKLSPGIYFVSAATNDGKINQKLIKR